MQTEPSRRLPVCDVQNPNFPFPCFTTKTRTVNNNDCELVRPVSSLDLILTSSSSGFTIALCKSVRVSVRERECGCVSERPTEQSCGSSLDARQRNPGVRHSFVAARWLAAAWKSSRPPAALVRKPFFLTSWAPRNAYKRVVEVWVQLHFSLHSLKMSHGRLRNTDKLKKL